MQYQIISYETAEGKSPFELWLCSLKDREAKKRILRRIDRAAGGNFGLHRGLGQGLSEMKIDYGAGYRVYYHLDGNVLIVLLCGGDKTTQNADINNAKKFLTEYIKENTHE